MEEQQGQVYNQIKNKKYEFTSIESKNNENNNNNNNNDIKSDDYVPFNTRINLQNIEREGFLRVVGYINGQSFSFYIL